MKTKQVKKKTIKDKVQQPAPIAFLLPCNGTPILTSDLLYTVLETKQFGGCHFVLLLDIEDVCVGIYKELVENLRERGMNVGYLVFDGTPYCGKINKAAAIINSLSFCVLDNNHMVIPNAGLDFAELIKKWQTNIVEPMYIGCFEEKGQYPVVSRKFTDRLGYMFHPICFGKEEAECWLTSLATHLEIVYKIPDCIIIEAPSKTIDIHGVSFEEDTKWSKSVLSNILDDEVERLSYKLLK